MKRLSVLWLGMAWLAVSCVSCCCMASPITSVAVVLTGSGTFETGADGAYWQASVQGLETDGNWFTGTFFGRGNLLSGIIYGSNAYMPIGATIGGTYFSPGYAGIQIGNESGYIIGYDIGHNQVIEEDLIGAVTVTASICLSKECAGTFLVHAPEPGTWVMVGSVGVVLLLWVVVRSFWSKEVREFDQFGEWPEKVEKAEKV